MPVGEQFETVAIRRVARLTKAEAAGLADLLVAVVADGASVGFLPPLGIEDAAAYWRRVGAALADGVVLLVAEAEAEAPRAEATVGETETGGAAARRRIVGTVQLQPAESANGRHRAEVAKLLVHPGVRRRGLGRALMARLEDEAATAGRTLLTLDTRDGDPSNALYRALGYAEFGRCPGWARSADGALHTTVFYWKRIGADPTA